MDFRMRSLKENKQNYNSMAEFPRHFHPLSPEPADLQPSPKIRQIQVKLNTLMETQRTDAEANNAIFAKLEQRMDRIQQRALGFDRHDSQYLNKNEPLKDMRNSAPYKYNSPNQDTALLKQSILSDLSMYRQEIRKQNTKNQQIQMRQARVEQELRDWINSQRLEMSMRVNKSEQLRGSQLGKQYHYDNLKGMVNSLESKVQMEMDSKGRSLATLKKEFQLSLSSLRQEVGREMKNEKDGFSRLVRQIKDSFQDLKEALGKDREQVKQAIFSVQTTQQNSFNSIISLMVECNRAVQTLGSNTSERQEKLEKKVVVLKDEWSSFKLGVSQRLQEFKALVMNIERTVLQSLQNSKGRGSGGNGEEFQVFKEEMGEWKKLSEQKNLNVFREISNAIKVLRMQWRKEHDQLNKEFEETSKSVKQIRQSVGKRVDKELLSLTQTMNEQFEALTLQLQRVNDFVALSKKETEEKLAKQLVTVKEGLSSKSSEAARLAGDCSKKLQGLQASYKQTVKQLSNSLKEDIANVQKGAKLQIQSLVSSITQDNEQWQKDLNGKVKALKETFNQQMQSNNTNQTKQYSEQLKKIESSFESLKKSMQSGLSNQRSERAKQVSKCNQQLTGLINQCTNKLKKQRETGQTNIKLQLKKVATQGTEMKQIVEELKSKAKQKAGQDQKKMTQLKTSLEQSISKVTKTSQEESGKLVKRIQTLKTQFQGKLKMNYDKLMLQFNLKRQTEQKAKQQESKTKYAQLDKKIGEANTKIKADIISEISKSIKAVEQQLGKNNKKWDTISSTLKSEVQKERKFCIDEVGKAKGEIQAKMKVRDQKAASQISAKKDQELKNKLTEVEKKTNQSISKLKIDIMGEFTKAKTENSEELTKIKGEVQNKIKASEQIKAKKEVQSKAKQNQMKQKQNQLKNRSLQLDKKIEILKKDIQKSTLDEITKVKVQMQAKIESAKIKSNQLLLKAKEEDKGKLQEISKKIESVRDESNKKIAQLKGVSLQSMKSQQQQAKKAQDQKLQNIKLQLTKTISQSTLNLQKEISQKFSQLTDESVKLKNETVLELSKSKQAVNSLQVAVFSEREKNKAVYEKMSKDILDVADSMMAVIAEIKPPAK